ncbi:PH domain-containing protein [Streptomyces spongiae]|uniref:PH domain-containing protein n=1 Tax=Streptomyces spongiae TaxID=565072 RepID=A0A5N8XV21_9ACTN|nr:PH domain-containing protein [Streptomyces spongiae]MPY63227.1 PH domain-containing protein [Streptomyces spongiae]
MSTSDHQSPEPEPEPEPGPGPSESARPAKSENSAKPVESPKPPKSPKSAYNDRVYRSPGGMVGGVLLLAIAGWLGGDAIVTGHGRTPWLALATLLCVVPLVIAFSVRPAVFANDDRLRVRNPFRVVVLPWATVASLRSGFSNEVVDESGTKYQLWSVPVSLRARKRANRRQGRADQGRAATVSDLSGRTSLATGPVRAPSDQIMDDLRELCEARAKAADSQGEPSVRWSWEIMGPAIAGAVLLVILIAVG